MANRDGAVLLLRRKLKSQLTDTHADSCGNERMPMSKKVANDARVLYEIKPSNLLSFGPDTSPLKLESLNILIGANGAGKSNLIEALSLMRSTPGDFLSEMRSSGRIGDWVWKGARDAPASIEVVVRYPFENQKPLRHFFAFRVDDFGLGVRVVDERIEESECNAEKSKPTVFYRFQGGNSLFNRAPSPRTPRLGKKRKPEHASVFPDRSILIQRRDPELYPEITYLAYLYERFRIYRDWEFGRKTMFRAPQDAADRNDRLEEDFFNLGLVLNRLRRTSKSKTAILERLRDFYEGVSDFDVSVEAGTVQVFLSEGEFTIPAPGFPTALYAISVCSRSSAIPNHHL